MRFNLSEERALRRVYVPMYVRMYVDKGSSIYMATFSVFSLSTCSLSINLEYSDEKG